MQKTLRRSVVMATMPTIASFLFIFTMCPLDRQLGLSWCRISKSPSIHHRTNSLLLEPTGEVQVGMQDVEQKRHCHFIQMAEV